MSPSGPEVVRDASTQTDKGAFHEFSVSVVTDDAGFQNAKAVAAAVSDALIRGEPDPGAGQAGRFVVPAGACAAGRGCRC